MRIFLVLCLLPTMALAQEVSLGDLQPGQSVTIEANIPLPEKIKPDLQITSETAFAVNLDTQDVVFAKNETQSRSIASITKMMTAYVVLQQADADLDETITITKDDIALASRFRATKLRAGMVFTRERLLNLALMSSENVAAAALGRTTFPGGVDEFIEHMNSMAHELAMNDTQFVDPIGIGAGNVSTAADLVRLIAAASTEPVIRDFSTTKFEPIVLPIKHRKRPTEYHNTNALVGFRDWDILVQKTGFTNHAGHCVVMVVEVQNQRFAVVVLDSPNNQARAFDAIKIRQWIVQGDELTTDEAVSLSPYKFVLYHKHKPAVHRRHHRRP